jgi:hypothetical protein
MRDVYIQWLEYLYPIFRALPSYQVSQNLGKQFPLMFLGYHGLSLAEEFTYMLVKLQDFPDFSVESAFPVTEICLHSQIEFRFLEPAGATMSEFYSPDCLLALEYCSFPLRYCCRTAQTERWGTKAFGKQVYKHAFSNSADSYPKAESREQRGLSLYTI